MQTSKSKFIFLAVGLVFFFLAAVQPMQAQSAGDIQIVKMAPAEGAAMVKLSGGQPQVVRVGGDLKGWGTVRGISSDRLVIEQAGATGNELIVIRFHNGQQTIERIGQVIQPDQKPLRSKSTGSRRSRGDSD